MRRAALRGFGDGFAVIILPAYMTALGFDAVAVGLVATASLLGTALLTLVDRLDRAALRSARAAAVRRRPDDGDGTRLSQCRASDADRAHRLHRHRQPSGGDLGVAVPLEHAVLARTASDERRTQVFARYSLIGALCAAAGSLAASLPDFLVASGSDAARRVPVRCSMPMPRSA